ncbi:MAG TPA: hypothetical protein VFN55_07660 [Solirubrobacteraceae bacterium]|nr:hypothetical protein [Solirubrobacteraceae bacterium]
MPIEPRRRERRAPLVIAAILAALALLAPGQALASQSQEMILQDDQALVYSSPDSVAQTLTKLKSMGIDRVRVSVVWSLVAPQATANREPTFDATNPAAYPPGAWYRYDFIDQVAHQLGLALYFQPTAPAPNWATTPVPHHQGFRFANNINGKLYGQFVQAVGERYSGHYPVTGLDGKLTALPAIRYWGVYNEPNIGGWTTPQWRKVHGRQVEASPGIYRRMLDPAWRGLIRTGHRHDTILIGETAAYGAGVKGYGASMDPLVFVRALYCVNGRYRPLRGPAATAIGCPARGTRGAFVKAHPALFDAPGWAHHPYDFTKAPSFRRADPNAATLSGLPHLETALDKVFSAYGKHTKIPIYITEWGVQSRGPSPYVAFSQAQQAEYINEGEYMAFKNPRVRSFAQFLLTDAGPNTTAPKGSKAYWATFQSGLLFWPFGTPKPAYYAFELPLWLPHPRHGKKVAVWAQIRPSPRTGTIQFQPRGSSTWTDVAHVAPGGTDGYVSTTVSLPSAGSLRLRWDADPFNPVYSRVAAVH